MHLGLGDKITLTVFTARRCVARSSSSSFCPSVHPSVCHTRGLCPLSTRFDLRSWFLHHYYSFWRYHIHPKIWRESPRERALNEGGVSTNWRFSTKKPPYTYTLIRQRLLLITNRKSNMRFRFVPKSTTLVGLEMTLDDALWCITHFSEPTNKIWMKIDPY